MQIENLHLYYIDQSFEYCKFNYMDEILIEKEEYPIIKTINVLFFMLEIIIVEIRNKDPS